MTLRRSLLKVITQAEWEKELVRYYGKEIVSEGFTSAEFAAALKLHQGSASDIIKRKCREGSIRFAGYKETVTILGSPWRSPCYQFVSGNGNHAKPVGNVVRQRGRRD